MDPLVRYRGISTDVANATNKTIADLQAQGLPGLQRIQARSMRKQKWAARMSSSGGLELNTVYVKDKATYRAFVEKNLRQYGPEAQHAFAELSAAREQLTPRQLRLLDNMAEHLKFSRYNVGETVESLVTHELGHHFENTGAKTYGIDRDDWRRRISGGIEQAREPEYRYKLSEYPFSSIFAGSEIVAESWTAYQLGERESVAPKLLALFKEFFP